MKAKYLLLFPVALLSLGAQAASQGGQIEERLKRLERENKELQRKFDALAQAQEDSTLGALVPTLGEGHQGLGPAASKVYDVEEGISIGGYGEARYRDNRGPGDTLDFLRAVLYVGYRFDERWVFNSELEFEHASTSETGSVSVELAYLDYLVSDSLSVRAGLLLSPMGFINELHEPSTYLGVTRPETERRIIPTTWRELGVGISGDAGPMTYRAYVMGGFEGAGFGASGLRGGRERGSRASAEDLAAVVRMDYVDMPGVVLGGSLYHGNSDQGDPALGSTPTTIAELHGEYRADGLWARGLVALGMLDDVERINTRNGNASDESVGEELLGGYVELGYDVMPMIDPESDVALSPYVRFEKINTQRDLPTGFVVDPANDESILTVGINWQPIDHIVFKLDFQDYEHTPDRLNLSMGYAF